MLPLLPDLTSQEQLVTLPDFHSILVQSTELPLIELLPTSTACITLHFSFFLTFENFGPLNVPVTLLLLTIYLYARALKATSSRSLEGLLSEDQGSRQQL
jgi:hypothetical protein